MASRSIQSKFEIESDSAILSKKVDIKTNRPVPAAATDEVDKGVQKKEKTGINKKNAKI